MSLEPSTVDALLLLVIGLQAWMVKQIYRMKTILAVILSQCPQCRMEDQTDTEQIIKLKHPHKR